MVVGAAAYGAGNHDVSGGRINVDAACHVVVAAPGLLVAAVAAESRIKSPGRGIQTQRAIGVDAAARLVRVDGNEHSGARVRVQLRGHGQALLRAV